MLSTYAVGVLLTVPLSLAQLSTNEPCAEVYTTWSNAGDSPTYVTAQVANDCLMSLPVVQNDALDIVDGLTALMDWQSTTPWLKDPPSDYPFPAVDMVGELKKIRDQVSSGSISTEIEFERNITYLLGRAHDGHLSYRLDCMNIFGFLSPFGALSVILMDGESTPGLYIRDEIYAWQAGYIDQPSAITSINGQDAATYLSDLAENGPYASLQDKDAIFNSLLYASTSNKGTPQPGLLSYQGGVFQGESTTYTFANDSTVTKTNYAQVRFPFRPNATIVDGPSFVQEFCNATQKALNQGIPLNLLGQDATQTKTQRARAAADPSPTQLVNYPSPVSISSDGSLSGYFLDEPGFEETAVIVMTEFSDAAPANIKPTLAGFLDACRSNGKKYLVLDVTNNPGGTILVVHEVFKQLFPDLEPYSAFNFRINDALDILGKRVESNLQAVNPADKTAYQAAGGSQYLDASAFWNDSGSLFSSWEELYGPVSAHGANFTNLIRWNTANATFDNEGSDGFTVSGADGEPIGAQPFSPDNIIIVGDGQCSSSCTTLSNLLKWQGKVKSIAIGGRPQAGPMQSQGGVKGCQAYQLGRLGQDIANWFSGAPPGSLDGTNIETLNTTGYTLYLRTPDLLSDKEFEDVGFNLKNCIREGDTSYTPLQFVYEAADCRMWNRPLYEYNVVNKWMEVAMNAFGINDTQIFSQCVEGSTNHPSSLSGNSTLFNNGVSTNVTTFIPEGTNADDSSSAGGSSNNNNSNKNTTNNGNGNGNGNKKNGAGSLRVTCSSFIALVALAAVAMVW